MLGRMEHYPKSPHTKIRRHADRASYERAPIHALLDEALVCHVVHAHGGVPMAIPTSFVRLGETVYVHGARANQSLRAIVAGEPFSLSVSLLDGLVLSKCAARHSMNYRSATLLGTAREVTDVDEATRVYDALLERMQAGRSRGTRAPTAEERTATLLVAVEIEHAVYKAREGGPNDTDEDRALPFWSGVIPLAVVRGAPVPADDSLV
jgi:nitroimidazol reductase NimA-like FMN-containing flavoprotein (pyridoxamine 5'-phosphate oxidase superfamily)